MDQEFSPDPILPEIESFLSNSGMNATTFGLRAVKDPTLVHKLRRGRECRMRTRARIKAYIETAKSELSVAA